MTSCPPLGYLVSFAHGVTRYPRFKSNNPNNAFPALHLVILFACLLLVVPRVLCAIGPAVLLRCGPNARTYPKQVIGENGLNSRY